MVHKTHSLLHSRTFSRETEKRRQAREKNKKEIGVQKCQRQHNATLPKKIKENLAMYVKSILIISDYFH